MHSDAQEIPLLDQSVLDALRRLQEPGEPDVLVDVVTLFCSDTSTRLGLAQTAVSSGNVAVVVDVAHQLKGSSALIGAERMSRLASQLHEAARHGDLGPAPDLVAALNAAFEETRVALERVSLADASGS